MSKVRAVLGVLLAADADVRSHIVVGADLVPPRFEGGAAGGHAFADDRRQPPAGGEALQCLLDALGAVHRVARHFGPHGEGSTITSSALRAPPNWR